jgi:ferritin-like metal-binding protein YciE
MTTKLNVANNSKLKEFFVGQLRDIYWAEKKLVETLPKLQVAATNTELRNAFGDHLKQTENHVTRLTEIFELIDEPAISKKCPAMSGIADEGEDIIDDTDEGSAQRDVGLIFAGQKAEHYEIATYGGLVSLARILGLKEAAEKLGQTLAEEKQADILLTEIAEAHINYDASLEPQTIEE